MKGIKLAAVCAALVLVTGSSAFAGMLFVPNTYGLSARGIGMGNAMTGLDDDFSVTFFNPGALGRLQTNQVDLGYLFAQPDFTGGLKGGSKVDFDQANKLTMIGFTMNLSTLFESEHGLGLGFDISIDDNLKSFLEFTDLREDRGQFLRYGLSTVTMITGLGIEILPYIYLGGGGFVTVQAETTMKARTDMAGNTSEAEIVMHAEPAFAPIVNLYVPFERFSVGLTYRGEAQAKVGPIEAKAQATVSDSPLTDLNLLLAFKDMYIPQQVALGAGVSITKGLLLAVDCTWMNWAGLEDEVVKDDDAKKDIEIETKDIIVPRLGVEWEVIDNLHLRFGYFYEDSPIVTPGSGDSVILDNAKHAGSFGMGYDITQMRFLKYPLSINAAYLHHYLVPRTVKTGDERDVESSGNLNGGVITLTLRF